LHPDYLTNVIVRDSIFIFPIDADLLTEVELGFGEFVTRDFDVPVLLLLVRFLCHD
jgi:hypothetical protein